MPTIAASKPPAPCMQISGTVTARWFYFSKMTHDEVVLIKGYDSRIDGTARFTPHTAFEYPPDIALRKSIETRTFAFY